MNSLTIQPIMIQKPRCVMKGASTTEAKEQTAQVSQPANPPAAESANGGFTSVLRTTLVTNSEKEKYSAVCQMLDKDNLNKINELLSTGKLLDKKFSNDNSSVLDNLYKMATEKRAEGLDPKVVLNETVNTIYNPFVITQKFGDIPKSYQKNILEYENKRISSSDKENKTPISANDLDVKSNCCVAASIEFNLAHRMPAEFARMAEGLTSEKMETEKIIDTKSIASNYADSMSLMTRFNANPVYEAGLDKAKVILKPDENAIIRARIQNSHKDPGERSVLDVLMQSTLMNIGSAKTYDSLIDTREGQFDKGLANVEKTFTECIATGKNNVLVNYQIIDDDMNLQGYECPIEEIKKHITDALDSGSNVIIGYTYLEDDGKINPDGHEITIVGIEKDKDGKEYFVCKDTDNPTQEPVKYEVNEFLPNIHHAGIPYEVLKKNNVDFVEAWQEVLDNYKKSAPAA